MQKTLKLVFFFTILVAFILRVFPTDWDDGYYTHPDEAHIYNVVFQLEMPQNINEFLSKDSPLNPQFFAYGSFPLYLLKAVAGFFGLFDPAYTHYGNLYKIGRPLSAFFDVGTLILLVALSKKLFDSKRLAVIAGGLYAITVFAIQNAHFYTVDVQMVFWILFTLFLLSLYIESGAKKYILLAFASASFAVATKFTAVILVPFLVGVIGYRYLSHRNNLNESFTFLEAKVLLILGATVFLVTNVITQPYAYIDFDTFSAQIGTQLHMQSDATALPYTIQYVNTAPFMYPLTQIFLWGLGPILTSVALLGLIGLTYAAIKKFWKDRQLTSTILLLVFFSLFFFSLGSSAVKFMRYYLPLYPILLISAAYVIEHILSTKSKAFVTTILAILIVPTIWWTGAFMSIYTKPHPWIQASEWIHTYIPAETPIAVEHWDRSLPLYSAHRFPTQELELYVPDSRDKVARLAETLYDSTYIVIASNRVYDAVPNFPSRYPATMKYYDLLFNGQLGYTKVAEFTSYPSLFGITRNDQAADESFTVYDHPRVQIFKKTVFNREAVAQMLYNSL